MLLFVVHVHTARERESLGRTACHSVSVRLLLPVCGRSIWFHCFLTYGQADMMMFIHIMWIVSPSVSVSSGTVYSRVQVQGVCV